MKACPYCGEQNDDAAQNCAICQSEFNSPAPADSTLADPGSALVTLAAYGDLIEATRVKDQIVAAGIEACIPEEFSPSPFGNNLSLSHFTIRVAARDYEPARVILHSLP